MRSVFAVKQNDIDQKFQKFVNKSKLAYYICLFAKNIQKEHKN